MKGSDYNVMLAALVCDTTMQLSLFITLCSTTFMALNDDLSSSLTVHQVAETRFSHDRPVDANMASREHYLQYGVRIVEWTIY